MTKTCLNPACKKKFQPGHYGDRQLVCGSKPCTLWYKSYWSQIRKPPRGISDVDRKKLLKAVKDNSLYYSLLVVAAQSGLRKGELLGLAWADVLNGDSKVKDVIEIRGQWDDQRGFVPTKTGTGRLGYLLSDSRKALNFVWAKRLGNRNLRIWPLTESGVWKWFTGLQRKLKIVNPETHRPYRFHDLRHTAGVNTLKATSRLDQVQRLLGHKNPGTTMVYAQERPEDVVADLEAAFRRKK